MDIIQESYSCHRLFQFLDMKSRDSDNYRGISLYNAICKVYDHIIIFLCYNKFITSDMQFGFKANHSTIMCSLVFHEIINNYLKNGSNVVVY